MELNQRKKRYLLILFLIAAATLTIRFLILQDKGHSALLYLAVPFGIAVALVLFTDRSENQSWLSRYWDLTRASLIVMLGSSILLYEGFLCVLMFMPIYFGVMFLIFLTEWIHRKIKMKRHGQLYSSVIPVFILIASFEGVSEDLSLDRHTEVVVSKTVMSSIEEIKQNLTRPLDLQKERHWFLKMFPMPHHIDAESISEGDIHKIYFQYDKWFITNRHYGVMEMEIHTVSESHVETKIVSDTSYISSYMQLKGTHIEFKALAPQLTQVTLRISFDRKLDPAWYFSPLEQYGVEKTAELLMSEVIANG